MGWGLCLLCFLQAVDEGLTGNDAAWGRHQRCLPLDTIRGERWSDSALRILQVLEQNRDWRLKDHPVGLGLWKPRPGRVRLVPQEFVSF